MCGPALRSLSSYPTLADPCGLSLVAGHDNLGLRGRVAEPRPADLTKLPTSSHASVAIYLRKPEPVKGSPSNTGT